MSRPFSYNDENFTVIGNILFLHVKITNSYKQWDNIIEIPQAIYYRMYNKSNQVELTSNKDDDYRIFCLILVLKKFPDRKYYLYSSNKDIPDLYIGFYLVAWYYLKDI